MTNRQRKNISISDEKRTDLIRLVNETGNIKTSAASLNIKYENARKIVRKFNQSGTVLKLKTGGKKPVKLNVEEINALKELIDNDCTMTLCQLKEKILALFNKVVSPSTISRYIKSFNYSIKRLQVVTEKSLSDELLIKRKEYAFSFIQKVRANINLFFIDETGFHIEMRPFYGYSKVNTPAITSSPMIRSRNITVMACLSKNSLFSYKILENAGNRTNFYEYMSNLCDLCNELGFVNSVFVLDNAKFHHCAEIKNLVLSKNHEFLFLPAYTPIFNPIENMFSQWKNIVRRRRCRNEDELMNAIRSFEGIITESDCQNYFDHCLDVCYGFIAPT